MRKLEDPLNFKSKVIIHNGKYHITYHSFTEITQGGPEIGILSYKWLRKLDNSYSYEKQ